MIYDYVYCPFCGSPLGSRIEESKAKKYCSRCKWTYYPTPHIAVASVVTEIRNDKPSVLMVRRNREPFKGTWMFPAGFLEFGEHPEETLARELREETGLGVMEVYFMKMLKSKSDFRSPEHLVLFYRVKTGGSIKNNDTDENSDIQWKPIFEPIDIGFPHHQTILEELKSDMNKYLVSRND